MADLSLLEGRVSVHEIRVVEAVRSTQAWLTAREIAAKADVGNRTARQHASILGMIGVFEVIKVFGGYRYRMEPNRDAVATGYLARLETAKRAFGNS
jgi:hypothetical protein